MSNSAASPGRPTSAGRPTSSPTPGDLVAASSLGASDARMMSKRTPDAAAAAILAQVDGIDRAAPAGRPSHVETGTSLDAPQARALRAHTSDPAAAAILARVEKIDRIACPSTNHEPEPVEPSTPPDVQSAIDATTRHAHGLDLLDNGNSDAAVHVFQDALRAHPTSRQLREGLARAQYDSGLYAEARDTFTAIVSAAPDDDYAHFGLGLAAAKLGDLALAIDHLTQAATLRPDVAHYATALRGARAQLTIEIPSF